MATELFISDPHGAHDQLVDNLAKVRTYVLGGTEDRMHFVGDVYDRGPRPDLIMDELSQVDSIDIQWGNHDMVWMGAALGQRGCVANVVRICARYNNLDILEDCYGMDLTALYELAAAVYGEDPAELFVPKGSSADAPERRLQVARVQKAIAIIQFKVEAATSAANPSFGLDARNLLGAIDYTAGTVSIEGGTYEMLDLIFPTVNPADPYALTADEEAVMSALVAQFTGCEKLQRHMALFLERGSLYTISGNTLIFHACVPLNADGSFKEVELFGQKFAGRALFDAVDGFVRAAFTETEPAARAQGLDMLWYLWLGAGSPLFAKSKMATFELYFCSDKAIRKEAKNAFYTLLDQPEVMSAVLAEFGVDPQRGRMVCGHVPIKVKDGEDPVKAGGRVVMIDGGMSKAYQGTSGIAGLTLVCVDGEFTLVEHASLEDQAAGAVAYSARRI